MCSRVEFKTVQLTKPQKCSRGKSFFIRKEILRDGKSFPREKLFFFKSQPRRGNNKQRLDENVTHALINLVALNFHSMC